MTARTTFARLPEADLTALDGARVAIFGAAEASPYVAGEASHSAGGPAALRAASLQFAGSLTQYDFDLDATLFPDKEDR
uniref:hypothetical protein n=1 Tax=Sphingomonas sp. TaxID=28214 RepID=UPI003B3B8EDC